MLRNGRRGSSLVLRCLTDRGRPSRKNPGRAMASERKVEERKCF